MLLTRGRDAFIVFVPSRRFALQYATGLHYHYQCVLNSVDSTIKGKIIASNDKIAALLKPSNKTGINYSLPQTKPFMQDLRWVSTEPMKK